MIQWALHLVRSGPGTKVTADEFRADESRADELLGRAVSVLV